MIRSKIQSTLTGKIQSHGDHYLTAITKTAVQELIVKKDGIKGDEVNNTKYHGGEMRVIHHFSEVHYSYFKHTFPDISERFIAGSFGENIYTLDLSEEDFCVGDIFSLGTTKLQLTASRRPCATINVSYQDQRVLKEVMRTGRTGWFYRVLEEGSVKTGDFLEQIDRPFPHLPLPKLHVEGYGLKGVRDLDFLQRCLDSGMMDKGWKPALEKLLST